MLTDDTSTARATVATRSPGSWGRDALAGSVAAGSALALSELVTGLDPAGPSLVTAVGDQFIDRFAASLKDLAVELFGTRDKVALVVGIVVTCLVLGALVGVGSRRRRGVDVGAFGAFGLVGFLSYRAAPLTSTGVGLVAALVAAAGGVGVLRFLGAFGGRRRGARVAADPGRVLDGVAVEGGIAAAPTSPVMGAPDRRTFLVASSGVVVAGAATAAMGRRLRGADPAAAARADLSLPPPVRPGPTGLADSFDTPGLTPYVTPTEDFYRIDTALSIPRIDPGRWHLDVVGEVDRPFSLDFDELLAMDGVEVPVTLQCVSNAVGGDLVGNAVWQGVPLADLLERAGVRRTGTQLVGRSVDGFTAGFPTELALDGRPALVAYGMNGDLLPARNGFPARLVVSGLYGYVSATKWLREVQLTGWDDLDGYWIVRGWAKEGPIKTASRLDVPRPGATVVAGPVPVAGVAWAPGRGVSGVELRVDDGDWVACELGDVANDHTWVQWRTVWAAEPGEHVLRVRAIDGDGRVQTDRVALPAPDGASGHHARRVRVA